MTKNQRYKILKAYQWKEEESKLSLHILDYFKTCHLQGRYAYGRELYTISIYALIQGYGFEWVNVNEARKALRWAFSKYKKDKAYFSKKEKEFEQVNEEIHKLSEIVRRGIAEFSTSSLKDLLLRVKKLGDKMYGYVLLSEGMDTFTKKDYQKFLPTVANESLLEVIGILSTPHEMGFVEKERLNLLKLAKEVCENKSCTFGRGIKPRQKDSNSLSATPPQVVGYLKKVQDKKNIESPVLLKKIDQHTKNYFWTQNSFYRAIFLDRAYFLNQIKRLIQGKSLKDIQKEIQTLENKTSRIKAERERVYKKYELSEETKLFFELVRHFSILQDMRKVNVQKLIFCIDAVLKEVEKKFGVQKEILNNYYFISDIVTLIDKGQKLRQREFKKRKKVVSVSYVEKGRIKTDWLFGKEADEIVAFFKERKRKLREAGIIKGFVASLGKGARVIQGRVRIVFDPHKDKFQKGEILVSGMTRPEFVPLMKKAKAIITNEGGITTHAAIISRELGVPCIIGTKVATNVLKTDDYIQIDLDKGIIKKIK